MLSAGDSCYKKQQCHSIYPAVPHNASDNAAIALAPASDCHDSIVPTVTCAAHTAFKTMGLEQPLKGFTRVLATTIRMVDESGDGPSLPDGHCPRITD